MSQTGKAKSEKRENGNVRASSRRLLQITGAEIVRNVPLEKLLNKGGKL